MSDEGSGGGRPRRELFLAPLPGDQEPPGPAPEEPSQPAPEQATAAPPARDHRRRLGAAAGLLAAVVLAAAASVLAGGGNAGDGDDTGETTATTTTARPQATTGAPSTSAGKGPPSGPLLPEATGAALVVVTGWQVLVAELDTGAVRSVPSTNRSSYHAASAIGGVVVIESQDGVVAVPARRGGAPLELGVFAGGGRVVPSDRPGHLWSLVYGHSLLEARELSVEGHETGRRFTMPALTGVGHPVAVDGGLVFDMLGSLTFYDPGTGEARAVGHGVPLAGSGGTLARLSCELLTCGLHLSDLRTGGDVEVPLPERTDVVPFDGTVFSPDGRWLAVGLVPAGTGGTNVVAVVDVGQGRVVAVHPVRDGHGGAVAFSPDSRWLFRLSHLGDVVAHRLGTDESLPLEGLHAGGAVALAAVAVGD